MRFLRENSLSLVLLALFALSMLGQALAGWRSYNESRHLHHEPAVALRSYLARTIHRGGGRRPGLAREQGRRPAPQAVLSPPAGPACRSPR